MDTNYLDITGLFLLMSGFVVGLGAVTVIDLHGFLGRKSSYWTEATTRTHKITKPLIWAGVILAILGGIVFYRNQPLAGIPLYHMIVAILLIINGLFLTFWVSPRLIQREQEGRASELLPQSWQTKITISLLVSDLGWWSSLFLLAVYLLDR